MPEDDDDRPSRKNSLRFLDEVANSELELTRVPTCAIFHKITPGANVPHAFYAFVRQLPAIPRLVVSVIITHCSFFFNENTFLDIPIRKDCSSRTR